MSTTAGAQTQRQDPSTPSNGQELGVDEGLLDAPLGSGAALDPGAGGASATTEVAYPNLGSQLSDLAVAATADDGASSGLSGAAASPSLADDTNATSSGALLLAIQLDDDRDAVLDFLEQNGVTPANVVGDYLEVYVPPDLLAPLSQQTGVSRVRAMPQAFKERGPVLTKGVALHGANVWHRSGFTGDGVKVGVIDIPTTTTSKDGFTGLQASLGTELPSTVVGRCYTDVGKPTSALANCDTRGGDNHGTRVAETLMDVAPDAALYISNPSSYADLHSAVVWMHGQGVKVIVQSISHAFHGSADGTSPINPSPLNTAKWAADNGIVWVNSAGNQARDAWLGSFNDSDNDNIHEWTSNGSTVDEAQRFDLNEGAKLSLFLRWDDTWGGASKDLDIEVSYSATPGGAQTVVGGSYDVQNGGGAHYPYESISLSVSTAGHYRIYVKKKASSSAPSWVQIMMFNSSAGSLDHYTTSGSMTSPGDSAHPAVLAVGAASDHNTSNVRHYSSRGPTPDGRTKPDIVGVDCGATSLHRLCGTSQAAPHVAGLAALVLHRNPTFTPTQVASYLENNAADRGAAGADNTWGHGLAFLPPDGLDDCQTALPTGGNIYGRLTASCRSRYYTFTLDDSQASRTVTIDLKRTGPASDRNFLVSDPYLVLRSGAHPRAGAALRQNEDSGPITNDARISQALGPGQYTIEATTLDHKRTWDHAFLARPLSRYGGRGLEFTLSVAGVPAQATVQPKPEVSIAAGPGVTEGTDTTFTVSASPAPSSALTVSLTVSQTGDFSAGTGSRQVTVPTSGSATYTVATINDRTDEADGSVSVAINSGAEYTVSSTAASATVAVSDDDDPPVVDDACKSTLSSDGSIDGEWTSVCASVDRAGRHARFYTFSLASQSTVTIDLESSVDTYLYLRSGKDKHSGDALQYDDDGGTGRNSRIVETLQAGDYTIEATTYHGSRAGSFKLTVAGLPTAQAVEPVVSITAGSDVTEGGDAVFTVTADPAPSAALSVDVTVAQSGDFGASTGSRQVTVPTSGSGSLTVSTTNDDADESDGSVTATVDDGSGYTASPTASSATVAVADNDDPPVVSITAGSDVTEGGDAVFTVTADPAPSAALSVDVTVAQSGDFGASTGSRQVTVPTSGSGSLTVSTTNDDADESDGSVTATVDDGSGYTASPTASSATVAVADNDDPPVVVDACMSTLSSDGSVDGEWTAACASVDRSGRHARFYMFSLASQRTVTIDLESSVDTYLALRSGKDKKSGDALQYDDDGGRGYNSRIVETVQAGDYTIEATTYARSRTGSFKLTVAGLPAAQAVEPEVSITAGSGVSEGGDAVFTVTADPVPSAALSVDVTVAQSGDFGVSTGPRQVTVSTSGTATLSVSTANDGTDEADGSVTVTVDGGPGYSVSSVAGSASVAVADDDDPPPPVCTVQLPSDAVTVAEVTGWRDAHDHDSAHVLRWNRVLAALGVDTGETTMTVAESRSNEGQFMASRWDRVTRTLEAHAQCNNPSPPAPPPPPVVEPDVSIAAGSGVTEGGDAVFTVTASPAPSAALTVDVTVTQSGDFGVSTGSRQVAVPISGTATLTVTTTGDSVDEADGSVTVTVNNGSGYTVSSTAGSAAVAVADDDDPAPPPPPPVVEPDVSIAAGSGVTEGGDAVFTVTASPAPSAALTVDVTVTQSGDFGAATGSRQVTIPTSGSATLTVSTVDDSVDESDGSVTVTVDDGSGYTVSATQGSAAVAVSDDDDPAPPPPPPVGDPGLSIEDASGTEGEQVSVRVTLSHASTQRLRVYWIPQFGGGSGTWDPRNPTWALSGIDFGAAGGWLTFRPGVVEQHLRIDLLEDSLVEPAEEFQVNLLFVSPHRAVPIADGRAIITITDND